MPTSGLGNLLDQLNQWQPYPQAMLLYIDIRHMRTVNRLAIAGAGDEAINRVDSVIRTWTGTGGVCGRLWSNEFIAAKAIDPSQTAIEEAQALRRELAGLRYRSLIGENPVAVSIGMVIVAEQADWAAAVSHASEACENAKSRGLNQIIRYTPELSAISASINAAHVLNFRKLMDSGKLTLHPQPIMDISHARPRLAKAEFLLRMASEDGFLPLPAGTIETLEYFGLAPELDAFTARSVIDWMRQYSDAVERLDGVTLNLSAKSLADGRFMQQLFDEVRAAHLPTGKLGFEITETAAVEHLELAADMIRDFQAIGCRFSLDDFGSGLCSFGYLQSLGVDEVKIDGRFTRDIAQNPVSQEIVRAIHQVALATGKRTVAEFVDEPRKLTVLQSLGIDYAQGWLFHPAVPTERFLQLLQASPTNA